MSQVRQTSPTNLTEGYPVSNLTLVVLLLIPCVVILLLLNCLFLGYKLLILSKKTIRQEDTETMHLQSTVRRARRGSDVAYPSLHTGRRAYLSLSEPALPHPVTSSRASSKERSAFDHRVRLLRPDGATGSGSLRAPSTIRATSSAAGFTPRPELGKWCKSDSEAETRVNLVPPNSPVQEGVALCDVTTREHVFDKVEMECEFLDAPCELSAVTSAVGPGLDSDFGASAGVSLRILSADSDGLSNGVLASALEWDYYDPCYVKQNHVPKQKHRAVMHTKQYWV